ncbi:MAG: hypothetical protein NTX28_12010 [Novosphingobium sp.]|nr:hypothetical protein [Novosphingobium sp.]
MPILKSLKPASGWNDFFREILIVFLGVLIALAFENLSDNWNWRNDVTNARQSIHSEISYNLFVLNYLAKNAECRSANFAELQHLIEINNVSAIRNFGSNTNIKKMRMIDPVFSLEAWETDRSSGLLAHMDYKEKLILASIYASFENEARFRQRITESGWDIMAQAAVFSGDQASRYSLIRDISQMRQLTARRVAGYNLLITSIERRTQLKPSAVDSVTNHFGKQVTDDWRLGCVRFDQDG